MSGRRSALFINENPQEILKGDYMIIFFSAVLNEIHLLGREYPWPKPDACPRCNGYRFWGHGFVLACFDGFSHPLCLKRYRCPDCRCVVRLRPKGYFKRFQASIATIRSTACQAFRRSSSSTRTSGCMRSSDHMIFSRVIFFIFGHRACLLAK